MPDRERREAPVAEDEQAIRDLLARLFDAWARGDADAYARCFSEDCDYITFNGMHLHGRSENASLHRALFRTVLRGTRISADILRIRLLAPHVALMHTAGRRGGKSFQTYVLSKAGQEWQIVSFQNTRVRPFSVWLTELMQRRSPGAARQP
jgi:uncharacterized protein (TIGR02246 family)